MMNVLIQISYNSRDNNVMRRGSFQLNGKTKEKVALDWWKKIQWEMPFGADLDQVIVDGEDITDLVKELDR
ncbi:hypothetical protein V7075_23775 [Neobacillus drentensis]|uniref:hypothetical protein n=1 Tax=Neobacillus drentensis TaxID=220684 RepID=UPI0030001597